MSGGGVLRFRAHLLDKVLGGLHVNIPAVAQSAAEEECLPDSSSRCVGVKLLHIARHTSKAGLLLWVAIDPDIPLNLASCNTHTHPVKSTSALVQLQGKACLGLLSRHARAPFQGHLSVLYALCTLHIDAISVSCLIEG